MLRNLQKRFCRIVCHMYTVKDFSQPTEKIVQSSFLIQMKMTEPKLKLFGIQKNFCQGFNFKRQSSQTWQTIWVLVERVFFQWLFVSEQSVRKTFKESVLLFFTLLCHLKQEKLQKSAGVSKFFFFARDPLWTTNRNTFFFFHHLLCSNGEHHLEGERFWTNFL